MICSLIGIFYQAGSHPLVQVPSELLYRMQTQGHFSFSARHEQRCKETLVYSFVVHVYKVPMQRFFSCSTDQQVPDSHTANIFLLRGTACCWPPCSARFVFHSQLNKPQRCPWTGQEVLQSVCPQLHSLSSNGLDAGHRVTVPLNIVCPSLNGGRNTHWLRFIFKALIYQHIFKELKVLMLCIHTIDFSPQNQYISIFHGSSDGDNSKTHWVLYTSWRGGATHDHSCMKLRQSICCVITTNMSAHLMLSGAKQPAAVRISINPNKSVWPWIMWRSAAHCSSRLYRVGKRTFTFAETGNRISPSCHRHVFCLSVIMINLQVSRGRWEATLQCSNQSGNTC